MNQNLPELFFTTNWSPSPMNFKMSYTLCPLFLNYNVVKPDMSVKQSSP